MAAISRFRQPPRSRFAFDWSAKACLASIDQSLSAITGQLATFSRTSAASCTDAAGNVKVAAYNQPRFQWVLDPVSGVMEPRLLIEGQSTNDVIQSDALTAANGWTVGALAITPAYKTVGALALSRVVGNYTTDQVLRSVTLTGNAVKAVSQVVAFDGIAETVICCGLYDSTAAAYRCQASVVFSASGVPTVTALVGTLLRVDPLAGAYRVHMQSTTCTAAHAHLTVPCVGGGSTTGSTAMGAVQVEDAPFPSSIISTLGAVVTRQSDLLSYVMQITPAMIDAWGGLTIYSKTSRPVFAGTSIGVYPGLWIFGSYPTGRLMAYLDQGGTIVGGQAQTGSGPSAGSAAFPAGDITLNVQVKNLTTAAAASIDVGSGQTAFGTGAGAITAFGSQNLAFGQADSNGFDAHSCLRVAPGLRSLAYMQAAA